MNFINKNEDQGLKISSMKILFYQRQKLIILIYLHNFLIQELIFFSGHRVDVKKQRGKQKEIRQF